MPWVSEATEVIPAKGAQRFCGVLAELDVKEYVGFRCIETRGGEVGSGGDILD